MRSPRRINEILFWLVDCLHVTLLESKKISNDQELSHLLWRQGVKIWLTIHYTVIFLYVYISLYHVFLLFLLVQEDGYDLWLWYSLDIWISCIGFFSLYQDVTRTSLLLYSFTWTCVSLLENISLELLQKVLLSIWIQVSIDQYYSQWQNKRLNN